MSKMPHQPDPDLTAHIPVSVKPKPEPVQNLQDKDCSHSDGGRHTRNENVIYNDSTAPHLNGNTGFPVAHSNHYGISDAKSFSEISSGSTAIGPQARYEALASDNLLGELWPESSVPVPAVSIRGSP